MNHDKVFTRFIVRSLELMQEIEVALLRLQQSPDDPAVVSAIPYATRAIRQLENFHGYQHIVAFSCVFECVLDRVRNAELRADADLIALLLSCCEHVSLLVEQLAGSDAAATSCMLAEHLERSLDLIHQLRNHHEYRQYIKRTWSQAKGGHWSSDANPTGDARLSPR